MKISRDQRAFVKLDFSDCSSQTAPSSGDRWFGAVNRDLQLFEQLELAWLAVRGVFSR